MFPAKAKSIIYLFMAGAPSHLDLLDYKPTLQQYNGQHIPEEFLKGHASPSSKESRDCSVRLTNFRNMATPARRCPSFSRTYKKLSTISPL